MNGLPEGWEQAKISDIAEVNPSSNGTLSAEALVSFVPMASVEAESGRVDVSQTRRSEDLRKKGYRRFSEGDVLFAKITPCMENGKAAVAQRLVGGAGFGSTEFHVLRPHLGISADYLLHYLLQKGFRREAARHMKGTAGQLRVPAAYLADCPVPVPPAKEQTRIVAAIEEQFSRLDAGVAALRTARGGLARFLRALIDREVAPNDRRGEWSVVTPRELSADERHSLAIGPFGSDLKVGDYEDRGVPLVFVRNIRSRTFDGSGLKYVSQAKAESLRNHMVVAGDVLVTKMGDPPGDTAVYPSGLPSGVITADCIKLTLRPGYDPAFIALALRTDRVRAQISRITSGVAQQKVSLARFRDGIRLEAPSYPEQLAIVQRIETAQDNIREVVRSLDEAERRGSTLRAAILTAAFCGKLVLQDPDNEPATALLERIGAETAQAVVRTPRSKRHRVWVTS